MTIDEAIKELMKEIPPIPANEWSQNAQAKALGIEAMKVVKDTRKLPGMAGWKPLPGETRKN